MQNDQVTISTNRYQELLAAEQRVEQQDTKILALTRRNAELGKRIGELKELNFGRVYNGNNLNGAAIFKWLQDWLKGKLAQSTIYCLTESFKREFMKPYNPWQSLPKPPTMLFGGMDLAAGPDRAEILMAQLKDGKFTTWDVPSWVKDAARRGKPFVYGDHRDFRPKQEDFFSDIKLTVNDKVSGPLNAILNVMKAEMLVSAGWQRILTLWFNAKKAGHRNLTLDEAHGWEMCYQHIDKQFDCFEHSKDGKGLALEAVQPMHDFILSLVNLSPEEQAKAAKGALHILGKRLPSKPVRTTPLVVIITPDYKAVKVFDSLDDFFGNISNCDPASIYEKVSQGKYSPLDIMASSAMDFYSEDEVRVPVKPYYIYKALRQLDGVLVLVESLSSVIERYHYLNRPNEPLEDD